MRVDNIDKINWNENKTAEHLVLVPDDSAAPGKGGFVKRQTGAPKVYRALLTQAGTAAPTAVVLENSIGAIVLARVDAGEYTLTLEGAFTADKTIARIEMHGLTNYGTIIRTSADVMTIITEIADGTDTDELLSGTAVEIVVYP